MMMMKIMTIFAFQEDEIIASVKREMETLIQTIQKDEVWQHNIEI
jgi:hypothetical protein